MDPTVLAQCLKRVVMVRVSGPDYTRIKILGRPFYHADNGVTTLSASGLLVDEKKGIIITSATLLSPFMNFNARRGVKDNNSFPKTLKKDTALHVLFEESAQRHHFARDEGDVAVHDTSQWRTVSLVDVVPCQLIDTCLKQLTGLSLNGQPGWEVGWHVTSRDTPAGPSVSPHDVHAAQSCWRGVDHVAVLQLSAGDRTDWLEAQDWTALKLANMERCERGEAMTMIGSPFGIISPPIFTNSTFQATVSNVIRHSRPDQSTNQHAPCLLMLDQLCLPGCEGGPVFNQQGELVGLIAPPLRKNDNSNVEVNLVIAVNSFASQLYEQHVPPPPSPPAAVANPVVEMIKSVQKSVALITVGAYWGSGILVSAEGYILTCAHLFRSLLVHNAPLSELKLDAAKEQDILSKFGKNLSTGQASPPKSKSYQYDPFNPQLQPGYKIEVRLDLLDSAQQYVHKWYAAELKYVSSSHWDLALLKLKNFVPSELNGVTIEPISIPDFESDECKEPQQGESIYVLGHGLFGPSKQMLPMSLNGIVSKIVYLRGKAQIIETSARVHRGVSGGILTNKHGQFIGLVTSNARQKDGRIVPNINFSIPARQLRALTEYLSGAEEDVTALQSFEVRDEECAALWKLRLTAPHNISDDAVKPLFPPNLNALPPPAAINSPESAAPRPPSSNFYNFIARFEEQMSKPSELPLMSNTNTPVNTNANHSNNNNNTNASSALKQPSISDLIKSKL